MFLIKAPKYTEDEQYGFVWEEIKGMDDFDLEDEGTKFFCSSKVMEAVRTLDYKQQYMVCEAFFNLMVEEGFGDDSKRCLIFHDSFQEINPRFLDRYLKEMHYLVNDFDNAIYEIDFCDPSTFFHVVRALEPIIEKEV